MREKSQGERGGQPFAVRIVRPKRYKLLYACQGLIQACDVGAQILAIAAGVLIGARREELIVSAVPIAVAGELNILDGGGEHVAGRPR